MRFINDPALGDYFIQVDDLNYSAFIKIIPDSGIPYHELHRINGRYGMATMCIGGGQGISVIIDAKPL